MKDVELTINGRTVSAPADSTVLEAARRNGIELPTLCAMEGLKPKAACKLCLAVLPLQISNFVV